MAKYVRYSVSCRDGDRAGGHRNRPLLLIWNKKQEYKYIHEYKVQMRGHLLIIWVIWEKKVKVLQEYADSRVMVEEFLTKCTMPLIFTVLL
jgi:hypothetical protein